ncbi:MULTISPECIES: type II toxin-antitoxin system HicB family antitoxin [Microcoleaceae]|uniref:type II toxin-antitoxin system HicB family antitoxin n=1 Tax=Microcoleaceae TaxID=1892252 RepID=UPI001880A87E|nr:type II toxin-antitoxin system HicB family antitoxin [Tychonema sp. LEGE 06208]MBE9164059.1 type II toxin-antitoxin system HicB family antitoxin [Tychonema sp. LEGE 06208]
MNRYSMSLQWSDEDQLFLVTIPEFADRVIMSCTHGKTREAAIRHGEEVLEMYL